MRAIIAAKHEIRDLLEHFRKTPPFKVVEVAGTMDK